MTGLRLRIDKYLDGDTAHPPEVYAKIYPLGASGARRASGRSVRQELIPLSHLDAHTKFVELEPGRYFVETVLPSGEVLADDVSVKSDETSELIFRPEYSPHEWLSWQHLVGNVESKGSPPRAARRAATRTPRFKAKGSRGGSKGGAMGTHSARSGTRDFQLEVAPQFEAAPDPEPPPPPPPEVNLQRPIYWLSHPHPALAGGEKQAAKAWDFLGSLPGLPPQGVLGALNRNQPPLDVKAYGLDATHAVFRVSWDQASSGAVPFSKLAPPSPRHFVAVARRDSVELVSLPVPWEVVRVWREADIEIAIQQPTQEGGFCASAVARDEQLGMLLGYLSSGSLPTARQMAETAREMLYYKTTNPFAAAAGAYALVGTALQATDRDWHSWVRNLMNFFPHVPDGAIQWGQLCMRMRRDQNDVAEARKAFKLAYKRGLPFYSMGVRWLLDGLELMAGDDDEAAMMLKNVRRLALRVNYQQPFTILKLGGGPSV